MSIVRCKVIHYRCGPLPPAGSLLPRDELGKLTQVHPELIEKFLEWRLVEPVQTDPDILFPDSAVPRILRIVRLRRDLGINWAGIGVVLDLLDRIETLERENARHRDRPNKP
jgi:hypothetical protein